MTLEDAAQLLDLIAKRAPDLRAAGVRSVALGETRFTLAAVDAAAGGDLEEELPDDLNPLSDPETFGIRRKAGRTVPTLKGA